MLRPGLHGSGTPWSSWYRRVRPHDEITKAEKDYEQAYTDLQVKHEALTEIIEDDAVFEEEEKYIDECQRVFLRLKVRVKDLVGETAAASHDQPTDAENPSPVDTYSSQVQRTSDESRVVLFQDGETQTTEIQWGHTRISRF